MINNLQKSETLDNLITYAHWRFPKPNPCLLNIWVDENSVMDLMIIIVGIKLIDLTLTLVTPAQEELNK